MIWVAFEAVLGAAAAFFVIFAVVAATLSFAESRGWLPWQREVGRYCGVCGGWLSPNDERIAARTGETKLGIHDACAVALAARDEE